MNLSFKQFLKLDGCRRGWGLSKTIKHIQRIKNYLKGREKSSYDYKILRLKQEMYQIRKHQKLSMRILDGLEKKIKKDLTK